MHNGKRFLLTALVVLFLASLLYPVWCPVGQGFDYVDNNTSNVDGAADIGSHSGFPAQQAGPDSTYDTLTEQNTGAGEITKIGTDTSGTGTSLTLSFSHTLVSGTARIVIVSIGVENGNTIDVSTVTYGGVTMTFAVEGITGTSSFRYLSEIWYILEADLPSEGSQTVAITFTGTASSLEVNAFCSEYTGVSQGAPEATAEHHQTMGTTITNDISPSENAWVLSVIGSGNTGSWTHGESQVEVHDFADSSSTFTVAELRGASGETSLSSTFSTTVNRLERVAASWAMAIEDNYELDLEVQWTNATFDQPNEELAIYGGTMGAENIRVDVWTGSSWNNLLNDLSTGWNNVSVTDYLTSPTFSIRFKGGIESGDSSQDTWEIDCTLLHTSGGNPPVANFSYTPESPYTGEAITFNASTSFDSDGSIVNYYWDFGDQTNGTGLTTTHVYNDDGTYPVNLTVTDDQGLTDTVTKDVTVLNRVPVASFTESASTVLTGESILFNASGSSDPDGFIVGYFWDFGDGLNGSGVTVSHSYVDDGGFTVTLTVTDDDGAFDSVSALKTVLNRVPVASFTESATTAYVGESISFNASASYDPDGYIVSYFWDFDDGFNATGVVVNHSYLSNGSFTVTLTVTDDDGGLDYAQSTITIGAGAYDLAILNAITSATEVYKYHSINVSVLVANEGIRTETFNVTLYAQGIHGWHIAEIDGRLAWYSDSKYSEDFLLQTTVDIPLNNPLLTFETKYDVEYLYDYCFVQLSVDGGISWISLMNAYTTYDSMPDTSMDIVDNLPGLTGTSGIWPNWMTMTFNLSDYAGESVLLGFRYMTDVGYLGDGWFLYNIAINGDVLPNTNFETFNPNPHIPLQTLTVENMPPSSQNILMFQWNASEIIAARYSLSAIADILVGETDTTDNVCFGGVVEVLMYPDVDGDGDVDIFDVVSVSGIYGCQEGEPSWNPRADLVEDGIINIFDVVAVASRYNEILELPKQMRLLGTRELGFRTT